MSFDKSKEELTYQFRQNQDFNIKINKILIDQTLYI